MSNVSADEGKKLYSPAIELYEKVKSNTIQFYNNLIGDDSLNLGFQSIYVCKIPNINIGQAINERLKKASYKWKK